jgi:hypothetical protein
MDDDTNPKGIGALSAKIKGIERSRYMALREQPYIPLYVQDFMTDEKLCECTAESTGVYIRLMCIMHKSEEYGTILLKQKDKQSSSNIKNFASKLVKFLPYPDYVIERSLEDLISNGVVQLDNDKLSQKRMVADNYLSEVRSKAGKKGGEQTNIIKGFAKAKVQANTEYENEYVNEIDKKNNRGGTGEKERKAIDVDFYVEVFNSLCTKLPKVIKLTDKRKKKIRDFAKDFSVDEFKIICANLNSSDFYIGKNDRGWKADFDYIMRTDKASKFLEGREQSSPQDKQEPKKAWELLPWPDELKKDKCSPYHAKNCLDADRRKRLKVFYAEHRIDIEYAQKEG